MASEAFNQLDYGVKPLRNSENQAAAEVSLDLFGTLGDIHICPMFGGAGVYCNDIFFALIEAGIIYIKADAQLSKELKEMGSAQFTYKLKKTGKQMKIGYWQLPEKALENSRLAAELGSRALEIDRRAK